VRIYSAGAISVSLQLHAFGQSHTDLFRGAILQSGSQTTWTYRTAEQYQAQYDAIVNATGCANASNTLACLRGIPKSAFISAANGTIWGPTIDGVFLKDYPTVLIEKSRFAKMPLLLGANTDEGVTFGPRGNNKAADIVANLARRYPRMKNASIDSILDLYEDDPFHGCPYNTGDGVLATGIQDKRALSIWGDIYMHAGVVKVLHNIVTGSHDEFSDGCLPRKW
jgi:acetylcholinesterase